MNNPKLIGPNLISLVKQIEKQNQNFSILAAREFRYKLQQTLLDITISEPRKFNVLEEFILRASIEFIPAPTVKELADVLGLDAIFVQNTAANLASLETLELSTTGSIKITSQGRKFYNQGTISLPPQTKQVYAISDPFQENISFQFSPLSGGNIDLPDLGKLASLENININEWTLSEIQQFIETTELGLNMPQHGKIVTNFDVIGESQICWQNIAILVLFDIKEDRYTIQVRRGKQILDKASNWLLELEAEQKVSLNDLCQLTEEAIKSFREATQTKSQKPKERPKKRLTT
ncbi:MAG: hypothetical protein KME60_28630 [Cyanomargarita calcarea GSE-NOS-MK-12-04C]|jgi:hypothetical protein|uniref:Uncharacterized protein n=1 Tax=Cyanomargarita calcarea GSE-NOS-MK-12-04C TaxID=2839659 RepID=A0A951UVM0_9CYAN|nr:hypothetical protein [Cyanomargarita calcarea GSE-NOS-MK-12-04C]